MIVADNVYLLESTKGSFCYLLELADRLVLIDTCFAGRAGKMLAEIRRLGFDPVRITDILLTHHDVDHVGNAADLQKETKAKIWAPGSEVMYITGKKRRPGMKAVVAYMFRYKKPVIDAVYKDHWVLMPELKVLQTPGHTPGHVSFLWKDVLFTGDLVMTVKGIVRRLPGRSNWNEGVLSESIRSVGREAFRWICPAHGRPVERGVLWEQIPAGR
jgi:glyoxylase-like metal-dependent hydrolase (beta-lactamase superfamily II)